MNNILQFHGSSFDLPRYSDFCFSLRHNSFDSITLLSDYSTNKIIMSQDLQYHITKTYY